ncbi:hypothetical protein C8R46DRAFT_1344120 [Mycena filopes]|nr:hypothetical protein C8R46DRAFT_1344120 [Mycena filopes]
MSGEGNFEDDPFARTAPLTTQPTTPSSKDKSHATSSGGIAPQESSSLPVPSTAASLVSEPTPPQAFAAPTSASPRRTAATVLTNSATPHRGSSHDSEAAYRAVEEIKLAVNAELQGAWVEEHDSLPFQAHIQAIVDQEYPNLDQQARDWLETYDGYDNATKSWTDIPVDATKENVLYDPIMKIMQAIITDFGQNEQKENGQTIKRRRVHNTHKTYMSHNAADASAKPLKSEPDISVSGTGPAATKETKFLEKPSYAQAGSLVEVKLEPTFGQDERDQVAVYAREVFIQQSNRRHVYIPLMTAKEIRVLRFDRTGCYYSKRIDYHTNALFFVKLVVLLSSLNEELIGFDTSIYWKDGQRFMKMTPPELYNSTTGNWEVNTTELIFRLTDEPVFSRRTIRSRGTVCWSAEYRGRQYIVKDYWRAEGRARESEFLKELVGIKGVGQMFAYNDDRESVKAQRGFKDDEVMTSDSEERTVLSRWFTRLVLPKYGDTLEKARSARQLLCAIRDIVQGHRDSLGVKGILHRDISFANLLLSPDEDASGVLIDWDLAKKMKELIAGHSVEGDSRTGTRAYQSMKILMVDHAAALSHHDHMDDIESIYYVLYAILYGYDISGGMRHSALLVLWHNPRESLFGLSRNKRSFLQNKTDELVSRFTGPEAVVLKGLVEALRKFFTARVDTVTSTIDPDLRMAFPAYSPDVADADYQGFLDLISAAILELPELPVCAPPTPSGTNKRPRTDDGDPTPARKKPTPSNSPTQATASPPRARTYTTRGAKPRRKYKDVTDSEESDDDISRPPSPSPSFTVNKDRTPRRRV